MIRNALITVSDKKDIVKFCQFLVSKDVTVYSTGGTYKQLSSLNNVKEVSSLTQFPEILDGRVKTLHPTIYGGILARRDKPDHIEQIEKMNIPLIDLVVVNLYPFQQTVNNSEDEEKIIENIDIGGHSLIRASAKNYKHVLTIVDPLDYEIVIDNWSDLPKLRFDMAKKAWHHVTEYDMNISRYFQKNDYVYTSYKKEIPLKYGMNPQQSFAGIYRNMDNEKLPFEVLHGLPGYINMLDAVYSWNLVNEASHELNCVVVASFKHTSPAGVGTSKRLSTQESKAYMVVNDNLTDVATAFIRARNSDPMCSFGDFVAFSHPVDVMTAKLLSVEVSDGIVAPDYEPEALNILKSKKQGNYLILKGKCLQHQNLEIRELHGLTLVQEENKKITTLKSINSVSIPDDAKFDLVLANITLKYTQSNSVCAVVNGQTVGVGAGQQSRIDCVKLVKRKTLLWWLRQHPKCLKFIDLFKPDVKRTDKINSIVQFIEDDFTDLSEKLTEEDRKSWISLLNNVSLASDAFFPFTDNIDVAAQFGVKFIIQPGGSVADDKVIQACDEHNIRMVMTGKDMRMFLH